jgi:hypothetical protein
MSIHHDLADMRSQNQVFDPPEKRKYHVKAHESDFMGKLIGIGLVRIEAVRLPVAEARRHRVESIVSFLPPVPPVAHCGYTTPDCTGACLHKLPAWCNDS